MKTKQKLKQVERDFSRITIIMYSDIIDRLNELYEYLDVDRAASSAGAALVKKQEVDK